MRIPKIISSISDEEKTPAVVRLLELVQLQAEKIELLEDEIKRLKGLKKRPRIKPSKLEKNPEDEKKDSKSSGPKTGSRKRKKTASLQIHEDKVVEPEHVPEGSRFKGYNDFVVQDLAFEPFNVRYRLARYETPEGESVVGRLPSELEGKHFGVKLRGFVLYQYYHVHATGPAIWEQLREIGCDVSPGEISRILLEGKDAFHAEKEEILRAGVAVSRYLNVDDTGARHEGKNGYCTHVGNEIFAYFESSESKSRINFLKVLRGAFEDYVVNADALSYMASRKLPADSIRALFQSDAALFSSEERWLAHLAGLGIESARHVRIATEGALVGAVIEHGLNPNITIVSDDAGQFNVFAHALCWIHAERIIAKMVGFTAEHRSDLEKKRSQIWDFYRGLKEYKVEPSPGKKAAIEARFDEIFLEKTSFATLNQALKRLHRNKDELLLVLERPETPLHNNLSENDIRDFVKKRKISGSTRSPTGRKCRDTFASLKKTCRKHGVSFWDYLMDRLKAPGKLVPYLPDLIRRSASEAPQPM
jgi:hypothetical protein